MTERLLQYIWQFQYYNQRELFTEEGEKLYIIHPGNYNNNQGPDFLDAKIKTGNTIWAGSIELHIKSSHWKNHKHSSDDNYKNIILHVVWENDSKEQLPFPTVVLQHRVSKPLLKKYEELMSGAAFIPCGKNISSVKSLSFFAWKERLLAERLQDKAQVILTYLQKNNYHWEETFWWLLAKNFGIKVNSVAFEKVAQSIPVNVLAKHKNQLLQIEAMLFGQAGLLNDNFAEDYPKMLQKEYFFLQKKHKLVPPAPPIYFLRMRPANFPTVRLAQLAALVHGSVHLFSKIKECSTAKEMAILLNVTANDYWHYHYRFDEPVVYKKKQVGRQMVDNILINTVAPVLFAYGQYHNEAAWKDKAIKLLEHITAEKNAITRGFEVLQVSNKNAFDSQALLQLKNNYCNKKRCLDCVVSNELLKKIL